MSGFLEGAKQQMKGADFEKYSRQDSRYTQDGKTRECASVRLADTLIQVVTFCSHHNIRLICK